MTHFEYLNFFLIFLQKHENKAPLVTLNYKDLKGHNRIDYLMCITPQAFDFPYPKSSSPMSWLYLEIHSFCGDIIIGTFRGAMWENRNNMNNGKIHDLYP